MTQWNNQYSRNTSELPSGTKIRELQIQRPIVECRQHQMQVDDLLDSHFSSHSLERKNSSFLAMPLGYSAWEASWIVFCCYAFHQVGKMTPHKYLPLVLSHSLGHHAKGLVWRKNSLKKHQHVGDFVNEPLHPFLLFGFHNTDSVK